MSRDWVIDKLSVGVTYDTDLDKVKKVIKKDQRRAAGRPGAWRRTSSSR